MPFNMGSTHHEVSPKAHSATPTHGSGSEEGPPAKMLSVETTRSDAFLRRVRRVEWESDVQPNHSMIAFRAAAARRSAAAFARE